jgi:hypothetical protein
MAMGPFGPTLYSVARIVSVVAGVLVEPETKEAVVPGGTRSVAVRDPLESVCVVPRATWYSLEDADIVTTVDAGSSAVMMSGGTCVYVFHGTMASVRCTVRYRAALQEIVSAPPPFTAIENVPSLAVVVVPNSVFPTTETVIPSSGLLEVSRTCPRMTAACIGAIVPASTPVCIGLLPE